MGCIHHLIKFIAKLASLSEQLRLLLPKSNVKTKKKLHWNENHTLASKAIKDQIRNITEKNTLTSTNKPKYDQMVVETA